MTDISAQTRNSILQEFATIGAGLAGGGAALTAGYAADSIALACFGLDSFLRVAFSGLVTWKLGHPMMVQPRRNMPAAYERRTLFAIGVAFFVLMLSILHEAGSRLSYAERPDTSIAGLAVSLAFTIGVSVLAALKRNTVRTSEDRVAIASASMTMNSAAVSALLFLGLSFHLGRGWWWADPAAAVAMLPFLCWSGWQSIELSKKRER